MSSKDPEMRQEVADHPKDVMDGGIPTHRRCTPGTGLKILISSHAFLPSLGGIEMVTDVLARAFQRKGHQVKVTTDTPEACADDLPYRVVRRPSPRVLLRLVDHCDVYLHNNISLRVAWPLLLRPRRWVVVHQTWLRRTSGRLSSVDRLKRLALRSSHSIAISQSIARDLPVSAVVVPNPYRDDRFRLLPDGRRDIEMAFLGRLVSDKGAALLLDALGILRRRELTPNLLIVGSGPEEAPLRQQAATLGLAAQVEFAGPRQGKDLVYQLNRCRILVVPSLWAEPFGVVALEGIACGCVVVGSAAGGLPEAIGPCGLTFPNGNAKALAEQLEVLLRQPARIDALRQAAPAHLARHTADVVAASYLAVMTA